MSNKMVQLVKGLHRKTLAGQIRWEQTTEEETYQASFTGYAVWIDKPSSAPRVNACRLRIFSHSGTLMEEVYGHDVSGLPPTEGIQLMQDLYVAARRIAVGLEDALNAILDDLER